MNKRNSLLFALVLSLGLPLDIFAAKPPCSPSEIVIVHDNGRKVELYQDPVSLTAIGVVGAIFGALGIGFYSIIKDDRSAPAVLRYGMPALIALAVPGAMLASRHVAKSGPALTLDRDRIQMHSWFGDKSMHWGTYSSSICYDTTFVDQHGVPHHREFLKINGKDGSQMIVQTMNFGVTRDQLIQLINHFVAEFNQKDQPVLDEEDDDDDVPVVSKKRKKKKVADL